MKRAKLHLVVPSSRATGRRIVVPPPQSRELANICTPTAYSKQEYYVWQRKYPVARLSEWVQLGARVGVDFSWTGLTGNTRDSHKLLRLALEKGPPTTLRSTAFTTATKPPGQSCSPGTEVPRQVAAEPPGHRGPAAQMQLLETMFHEYFELDRDISSHSFLADVGSRVLGIPAAEVLDCLEREDWDQATEMLIDDVRNRGFRAIPQFIMQDRYLAGGWQQPSFFLDIFEQIRTKDSRKKTGSGGGRQGAQDADADDGRAG